MSPVAARRLQVLARELTDLSSCEKQDDAGVPTGVYWPVIERRPVSLLIQSNVSWFGLTQEKCDRKSRLRASQGHAS